MPVYQGWEDGPTPLHRLLLRIAPKNHQGVLSLNELARRTGYTRAGIYYWVETQRISAIAVQRLIDFDTGRPEGERVGVTRKDFEPFVYNS